MKDEVRRAGIQRPSFILHPSYFILHHFPYTITSANSFRSTSRPFRPWLPSTTAFSRTSLVLIMSTLMPASASDWNIRVATLVWLRMPVPETDNLATLGELVGGGGPDPWARA